MKIMPSGVRRIQQRCICLSPTNAISCLVVVQYRLTLKPGYSNKPSKLYLKTDKMSTPCVYLNNNLGKGVRLWVESCSCTRSLEGKSSSILFSNKRAMTLRRAGRRLTQPKDYLFRTICSIWSYVDRESRSLLVFLLVGCYKFFWLFFW